MYNFRRLFGRVPPKTRDKNARKPSFSFKHGMLLEELDIDDCPKGCLHIRIALGRDKNEVLLEAKDEKEETWLLGLPAVNGDKALGHKEVLLFWKQELGIELCPNGGFLAKYEGKELVCRGKSKTYPGEVDVEFYKEVLQELLNEGSLKTPEELSD